MSLLKCTPFSFTFPRGSVGRRNLSPAAVANVGKTSPAPLEVRLNSPRQLCFSSSIKRRPKAGCRSASMAADHCSTSLAGSLQDSLSYSKAYWPSKSMIAWNVDVGDGHYVLYASKEATLSATEAGIKGYDAEIQLEVDKAGLPTSVTEKFPHIKGYRAFRISPDVDLGSLLKCQLAVAAFSSDGILKYVTGLQLPGVLDELYHYDGPLGAVISEESLSLYLWAPTAQNVRVCIYAEESDCEPKETVQLQECEGVWYAAGPRSWEGRYYQYEVTVYHYSTLRVEKCIANDPYARGVSADASKTLFVNLDCDSLKPEGWDNLANEKPELPSFSDITLYELHIRDFSANDPSVHPDFRGGYLAFTKDSAGTNHLKTLSDAGLTHLHLLPSFQFAGVDDVKENWKCVDTKLLESLPPDSEEPQARISAIKDEDPYNWGYNPVLWGVPKGSYSTNPTGPWRTLEYRKMVQALNHIGLRVVLDVVYNHLAASGPYDESSVLDKIVPGYYLRRNHDGFIEHSAAVNNTASEHYMVERLIIDDLISWAINYKVDGFRFDLMGHIMKDTMGRATRKLRSLSKDIHGVDGKNIYIYGEGWDFGEVAKNARGVNASQLNLGGTGIGSFNDRIRDAMLGGGPFGPPLQQGFVTGLSLQPNAYDHGGAANAAAMLARSKDFIQAGMAGNLRDFVLTSSEGRQVKGSEIHTYDGLPVAYAVYPTETINYVSAHDNETLFDNVSLKTAVNISVEERTRNNHLATSIITLSQGIPFFHAGDELLRSKSLDRDSYNSGDWFNRLDFTYNSNNWGVGLPPRDKNENNWPLIKPRLADPSFKPQRSHIIATVENFINLLRIRYSSPLFRLRDSASIQERVHFHNTGPSSVPGVIVMSIEDGCEGVDGLTQLDPRHSSVAVVVNASPNECSLVIPALRKRGFQLHPVQLSSNDCVVKNSSFEASSGTFNVPAKTTAVFVEPRNS